MRNIAFLTLFFLFIGGFVFAGYKIVKERWTHKLLSPLGEELSSAALRKTLQTSYYIEQNLPVEYSDRVVASISGVTVIFPKIRDYSEVVTTLQTVLNGATMDRTIVEIDLRFEKPVVKYGS